MSEFIDTLVEAKESSKPEFSVDKFYEFLKNDRTEMLSAVKWSLSLQDKIPGVSNDERTISFIQGNLRGLVAEELSNFLGFKGSETVFRSEGYPGMGFSLDNLDTISPGDYIGCSNKKADIISTALKASLDKKPLSIYGKGSNKGFISEFKESRKGERYLPKDQYDELLRSYVKSAKEDLNKSLEKIKSDVMNDYESPPRKAPSGYSTLVGEVFQKTVIPDAFIVRKGETGEDSELLGSVEVKAYDADELATLIGKIRNNEGSQDSGTRFKVKGTASEFGKKFPGADQVVFNMGFDINKEVGFVDFIRGVSKGDPDLYEQNIVALRFPNDIPDNLLNQLGQLIVDYGYPNVVIQKLPLSTQEIDVISKKLIEDTFSDIWLQILPINFSEKEIDLLKKFINTP